ncbi:MAG TPA: M55 family metallopeptidase [Planctomycetota bacterium]|nr:M55 family metallopeptidase [Planctomycetota bacterium]
MNVYIMTDMEGVSGVVRREQVSPGTAPWREALQFAEADFNAAVAGAAAGGARRIVLCDAHGGGNNIRLEKMDGRAEYERPVGARRIMPALEEAKFDAGFMVGAHAMAGTQGAFLEHTQSSFTWHNYTVDGRRWGEIAQFAAWLGHFDVPLVLVTGDEAACREAREFLGEVETATVKTTLCRQYARSLPPAAAHKAIEEAAARALRLVGRARPFKPKFPADVRIEFHRADTADGAARRPGVKRLDGRTVGWTANSALELIGG